MSSFGAQIRKRIGELRQAGADVPRIIDKVAEAATKNAVEVATKNTPPDVGGIKGVGMRSGKMHESWAKDSVTKPERGHTWLINSQKYASYVNDGHRLDHHLVPGLVIKDGVLQKSADGKGAIWVGTKTTWVKGYYMKEKAIGKYRTTVRNMLEQELKERFK